VGATSSCATAPSSPGCCPRAGARTGIHVFGAHSDSPALKLKPKPTTGRLRLAAGGVEIYGGPLLNSWLDRELRLAGRLVLDDGSAVLAATGPLLRLPQLAIHLDREANDHLALNKQTQTQPVWGSVMPRPPICSPSSQPPPASTPGASAATTS
jgi:aspartyl aminopeptidase